MPIVNSTYRAPWYLPNRHLQTVMPFYWEKPDNTLYQTEVLEITDGDFLELDWIKKGSDQLILLSHGLEGNSRSHYVQQMAKHFSSRNWDVLAWNFRGCGRQVNRLPFLYHAGATDDLAAVVQHASSSYMRIVLVGFSIGANMTLNYAGRHKMPDPVKAVTAFSAPCSLQASEEMIDKWWHGIYRVKFLEKLKRKVRQLKEHHHGYVNIGALDQIESMKAFSEQIAAPLSGFPNVAEYYASGNCVESLKSIPLPVLMVNAQNDPFLADECYPIEAAMQLDHFQLEMPRTGGHSAFPISKTETWMAERVGRFIFDK